MNFYVVFKCKNENDCVLNRKCNKFGLNDYDDAVKEFGPFDIYHFENSCNVCQSKVSIHFTPDEARQVGVFKEECYLEIIVPANYLNKYLVKKFTANLYDEREDVEIDITPWWHFGLCKKYKTERRTVKENLLYGVTMRYSYDDDEIKKDWIEMGCPLEIKE
jgi:hypothetical protein